MPAAPEILEAGGEVRLAEVDHEVEAEQLSAAAGDVAVAAEIPVDLEGEGVGAEQGDPAAAAHVPSKAALASWAQLSAMTHLRKSPERMSMQPSKAFSRVEAAILLYLRQEMAGPLDWARDQMGKEADEEGVFEQRLAGSSLRW